MQHRTSRSRVRHRRAHWKATVPDLTTCPNPVCGETIPAHHVCPYRGRQILPGKGGKA
ncbi:50S ribosomal protein L32 [Rhodococcus sp. ACT016]|uniref:50S ribosomal protein L32 n=1 Tax=Rhodococcus sp. ACT016 TaxID=3134808 RepID=UPI003D2B9991